jgi:hypothetical protein
MKLKFPTVGLLVFFLGIGALIVYANATQPDLTGQIPPAVQELTDLPPIKPPDPTGTPDENIILSDDELREKVLPANDLLLPDLMLADPVRVVIQRGEGIKRLHFDTAFANLGDGDLHIYSTEEEDRFLATQILTSTSGSEYHVGVGKFQYKDEHEHWHLANFANYELWSVGDNGVRDVLVSSSVKVSFCIWDYGIYPEGNFNVQEDEITPEERQYPRCEHEEQGLTVGWFDLYDPFTAGQTIDILDVPNGVYILRTLINVNRDVYELEHENNESSIFIEIIDNAAFILDQPDAMLKILRRN